MSVSTGKAENQIRTSNKTTTVTKSNDINNSIKIETSETKSVAANVAVHIGSEGINEGKKRVRSSMAQSESRLVWRRREKQEHS